MSIKTYFELSELKTYKDRFEYLKLRGRIGEDTFGFDRYLNQMFYKDREWLSVRDLVILRDYGCDLGIRGHEIDGHIIVHHINPITLDDLKNRTKFLLDPNYLICTSHSTHNAIHYGNENMLTQEPIDRYENDTCPWKSKTT